MINTEKPSLRVPIFLYILTVAGLFLYSFTQIDLSLTFSRIEVLRNIVKSFQHIGYFQRPLSTYIYSGLIIALFGFYLYFLKLASKKKISESTVWRIIILTSVILLLSYNAFSYDLFNYIFDAKIYTHYHLNPYLHKALDFPGDPMLSFMRWTHRTYPYGPVWLFITIPLSYIGMNFFIPTFFLFKGLAVSSFLGSTYLISKILRKYSSKNVASGIVFFGLNPLIILECLVSAHIDIVMTFFILLGVYMLLNKRTLLANLLFVLSVGIKFTTVFLIPVFLYTMQIQMSKKQTNWNIFFFSSTVLMSIAVGVASFYSGNFQPWYLILPLSFSVFVSNRYYIFIPSVVLSFFALLVYMPYLYAGNWNPPIPQILSTIEWSGIIVSVIGIFVYRFAVIQNYKSKLKT